VTSGSRVEAVAEAMGWFAARLAARLRGGFVG